MKREFLEGLGLEKDIVDKIIAEHGKSTEKLKTEAEEQTQKITDLETKLGEANTEIQSYKDMDIEGIKSKVTEWEEKYNNDKAAWEQEKNDRAYMDAVKAQLDGKLKITTNRDVL